MFLEKFSARKVIAGDLVLKTNLVAGAKDDTLGLQVPAQGIHINVAGTIKIKDLSGNINTLTVSAGQSYAYGITQIFSTGTSLANSEFSLFWGA